ncbi:hypothetical protein B296_00022188 [Ensete ventricosum]|uniref:Uncharacterized protein n=1 Tax=Ensete ventricosum TaxID=4639 RepID=A0A426YJH3_ENSVE|nr:hypothetical protein B296_00022188 [Ensete ventricosum]
MFIEERHMLGVFMPTVFTAACGATLAFSAMFVWAALVARRPVSSVECPVEDEYGNIESAGDEGLEGELHNVSDATDHPKNSSDMMLKRRKTARCSSA